MALASTVAARVPSIAVIIPFYQERGGVLAAALRSVFEQRLPADLGIDIIVVDDSSPYPAKRDVDGLDQRDSASIRIVRQANAGPAAARNTGLNAVTADSPYIAFLDSDDQWDPDHLTCAIASLRDGSDAFFANNWVTPRQDWFSAHPKFVAALCRSDTVMTADQTDMCYLSADEAVAVLIEEPLIHLSTLVVSSAVHGAVRFDRSLQTGEDHLFTLLLADTSRRIAVAMRPLMARGANGVNFYRAALDWNSPKATWRASTTLAKYRAIERSFAHRPKLALAARKKAAVARDEAVFLFLRNVLRHPRENLRVAGNALRASGWRCLAALPIAVSLIVRRLRGGLDFRV